jgi:uracil phosphoribosyltransferase
MADMAAPYLHALKTRLLKKWKAFIRKIDTKTDDFSTVLKTIKTFLAKPFAAAVEGKDFTERWSAGYRNWMQ